MILETAFICLALNTYHEAKNQSMIGQIATAQVVMNRVADDRYPNTVCEVVKQGPHRPSWENPEKEYPVKHRCQFSWYCDGKSDEPKDSKTWIESIRVADMVLESNFDVTSGALYYHAYYVTPYWSDHLQKLVEIEDHIFYK